MGRNRTKVPLLTLSLDPRARAPMHAQIAAQLRRAILERHLGCGTRLPSSRLFARELGCARGTVMAAFERLMDEGYVVSFPGSGMAVAETLPDDAMTAMEAGNGSRPTIATAARLSRRAEAVLETGSMNVQTSLPSVFALGRPAVDAFPFRLWARLLETEWRRPMLDPAAVPHPFGHPCLRRAISAHLSAFRGFTSTMDQVVVTSGIRQGLGLLARLLLNPRDVAWIEEPSFIGVRSALLSAGVRLAPVPVDDEGFAVERAEVLAPSARLAVVTPAHQFPLGVVMSLARRHALLAWAERTGGWIIEDDHDGEYRYSGRPFSPLRALDRTDRVIYCGGFSKLLFPALRLSYMVLPPPLVEPAALLLGKAGPAEASLLGQAALARFVEDGHFAAHLRRTRHIYAERQSALVTSAGRHLAGLLRVEPSQGGMHLVGRPYSDIGSQGFDDRLVTLAAGKAGIAVTPLSPTYLTRFSEHGLLLGYAAITPDRIEKGASRLRSVLER